jgi:hypothetical protein
VSPSGEVSLLELRKAFYLCLKEVRDPAGRKIKLSDDVKKGLFDDIPFTKFVLDENNILLTEILKEMKADRLLKKGF